MFTLFRSIATTFVFASIACAGYALADGAANVERFDSRDEVRMSCEFALALQTKTGPVALHCHARASMDVGSLIDFQFSTGKLDRFHDYLRFTCRDDDDRPYYYGPVSFGVQPQVVDLDGDNGDKDHFNAIVTGIKTTAPLIVIPDLNLRFVHHDEVKPALAQFNLFGTTNQVPGECRFSRERDDDARTQAR